MLHQHVEHLKCLAQDGHLLLCGPFIDDTGAMIVLQGTDISEVDALIQADPFVNNKFYGGYSITEFNQADAANNYLIDHKQTLEELHKR